jgi:hypothetical protein
MLLVCGSIRRWATGSRSAQRLCRIYRLGLFLRLRLLEDGIERDTHAVEERAFLLGLRCMHPFFGLGVDAGLATRTDFQAWAGLVAVGMVGSVTPGVVRCEDLCARSRRQIRCFFRQERRG